MRKQVALFRAGWAGRSSRLVEQMEFSKADLLHVDNGGSYLEAVWCALERQQRTRAFRIGAWCRKGAAALGLFHTGGLVDTKRRQE